MRLGGYVSIAVNCQCTFLPTNFLADGFYRISTLRFAKRSVKIAGNREHFGKKPKYAVKLDVSPKQTEIKHTFHHETKTRQKRHKSDTYTRSDIQTRRTKASSNAKLSHFHENSDTNTKTDAYSMWSRPNGAKHLNYSEWHTMLMSI